MRKKINLGFTIIILLVWIICLYTIFSSLSVQKLFNELNDDIVPGAIAMAKMKFEATDIRSWTLTYILRGNVVRNEKTIKEWLQESWSNLENEAQIHYEHEKHIGIEEQQSAEKIITLSQKLISASTEIINLKDQGVESDILFEKIKEDFRYSFYPLREKLHEHIKIHMEELADAQVKAQSKYKVTLLYIAILGIIVTLLAIFIGLFINKLFIRYITERKKAEEKLKVLSQAVTSSIDGLVMGDLNGRMTYVNKAFIKMFGYSKEELIGKEISFIYPEDQLPILEKAIKSKMEGGWTGELIGRRKDGELIPMEISSSNVLDDEGKVIANLASHRDITERKKAEEALRESEDKYRTLVESADTSIFTIDRDGVFLFMNSVAIQQLGGQQEDIIGKTMWDVFPRDVADRQFADVDGVIKSGQGCITESVTILQGEPRYYRTSIQPIKDRSGNINASLVIATDITERKKMEEEINRHREQLKLINTILRHDLANNLAVIKSAIRIYKVKKDESILDEASLNVNKSAELIRKMREHENLIAKESLKVFEISDVIKQVMENYPDIEFAIKGKKEIFADDALNSVIDNIFRNAVVHGKTNRIDIKIGTYKDRCFVKIADNGTGVPDNIKDKIFDEGFKYGKKAHTGMGLYIVKESVEKWGGSIFVEDNKPKGAVFVLLLKSMR